MTQRTPSLPLVGVTLIAAALETKLWTSQVCALATGVLASPMDTVGQRRFAAHAHSARQFENRAEFLQGVAALFAGLGDDTQARAAEDSAELERQRAFREWNYSRAG